MTKRSFILTANQTSIPLKYPINVCRVKVCKFMLSPENLTDVRAILLRINELDNNALISNNTYIGYTFCIPFVSNNFALSYTNDIQGSWDYEYVLPKLLNSFTISICNETGALLTMNNSYCVVEIELDV